MLNSTTPPTASNPWFAVSLGLAGLIVGYFAGAGGLAVPGGSGGGPVAQTPPPPAVQGNPANADDDAVLGDKKAKVTLIEFTDYQCPFCARHFNDTYGQIVKNYVDTGKVKLVVRDFPLSFHPHAQKAAEASECAKDQGKFWEMHDKLFSTNAQWSNLPDAAPTFKGFAKELGLNTSTFDACLDGGTKAAEVKKDLADGSAAGIDGTPGFWILGPRGQTKQISGAYPYATFQAAFDEML